MGRKRYRTERRRIDPRTVRVRVRSERAVQGYMDNPDWSGPDWLGNGGDPSVYRNSAGELVAGAGNHRIAAAARKGRKIDVDYQVEVGSDEDKPSGFFAWLFS